MLASGIVLLLENPGARADLLASPDVWPNALEEILRVESPVQLTARFASEDLDVEGTTVPRGRAVVALIGGANRDPRMFPEPDRFDIHRENAREHLSFSRGLHFCLGAGLARMEGLIGLRSLFERFPEMALAGAPVRRPGAMLRGYGVVPVRLGPRAAEGGGGAAVDHPGDEG
jgi:cytochrome P450